MEEVVDDLLQQRKQRQNLKRRRRMLRPCLCHTWRLRQPKSWSYAPNGSFILFSGKDHHSPHTWRSSKHAHKEDTTQQRRETNRNSGKARQHKTVPTKNNPLVRSQAGTAITTTQKHHFFTPSLRSPQPVGSGKRGKSKQNGARSERFSSSKPAAGIPPCHREPPTALGGPGSQYLL